MWPFKKLTYEQKKQRAIERKQRYLASKGIGWQPVPENNREITERMLERKPPPCPKKQININITNG